MTYSICPKKHTNHKESGETAAEGRKLPWSCALLHHHLSSLVIIFLDRPLEAEVTDGVLKTDSKFEMLVHRLKDTVLSCLLTNDLDIFFSQLHFNMCNNNIGKISLMVDHLNQPFQPGGCPIFWESWKTRVSFFPLSLHTSKVRTLQTAELESHTDTPPQADTAEVSAHTATLSKGHKRSSGECLEQTLTWALWLLGSDQQLCGQSHSSLPSDLPPHTPLSPLPWISTKVYFNKDKKSFRAGNYISY